MGLFAEAKALFVESAATATYNKSALFDCHMGLAEVALEIGQPEEALQHVRAAE